MCDREGLVLKLEQPHSKRISKKQLSKDANFQNQYSIMMDTAKSEETFKTSCSLVVLKNYKLYMSYK